MKEERVACKRCNAIVLIALDEQGRKIELDPNPAIYFIGGESPGGRPIARKMKNAYVSHFATCSRRPAGIVGATHEISSTAPREEARRTSAPSPTPTRR